LRRDLYAHRIRKSSILSTQYARHNTGRASRLAQQSALSVLSEDLASIRQELGNCLILIGSERSRERRVSCRPFRRTRRWSDRSRRSDFVTNPPCNNRCHGREETTHRRRRECDRHHRGLEERPTRGDCRVPRSRSFDISLASEASPGSPRAVSHGSVRLFARLLYRPGLFGRDIQSVRARASDDRTAVRPRQRGNQADDLQSSFGRNASLSFGERCRTHSLPSTQAAAPKC
jgi:hypothetical protein